MSEARVFEGDWRVAARRVAAGIRRRVLEMTIRQGGGYLSQACSCAEILAVLYVKIMRLGPSIGPQIPPLPPGVPGRQEGGSKLSEKCLVEGGGGGGMRGADYNGPRGPDLDRFFLSPAHYAMALYAVLAETGRLAPEALDQFNQDGGSLDMIGAEHCPGMEVTAGSLGQTISQAAGVAWARKRKGESGRVWLLLSDGEFQIGQTWEAFAAMSFYGLDNVGVYADLNGQQCDGPIETVMAIEPLEKRLEGFGARVVCVNGHDIEELAAAAERQMEETGEGGTRTGGPFVVLARTDPCAGIPLLRERAPRLHYVRFRDDAERTAYRMVLDAMCASCVDVRPQPGKIEN